MNHKCCQKSSNIVKKATILCKLNFISSIFSISKDANPKSKRSFQKQPSQNLRKPRKKSLKSTRRIHRNQPSLHAFNSPFVSMRNFFTWAFMFRFPIFLLARGDVPLSETLRKSLLMMPMLLLILLLLRLPDVELPRNNRDAWDSFPLTV